MGSLFLERPVLRALLHKSAGNTASCQQLCSISPAMLLHLAVSHNHLEINSCWSSHNTYFQKCQRWGTKPWQQGFNYILVMSEQLTWDYDWHLTGWHRPWNELKWFGCEHAVPSEVFEVFCSFLISPIMMCYHIYRTGVLGRRYWCTEIGVGAEELHEWVALNRGVTEYAR